MKITAGQVTIYQLFSENKTYLVPKYQRYYAWETEEVQDLLRDLWMCVDIRLNKNMPRPHFLGGILMVSDEQAGSPVVTREVIDGQQRLATISLLGVVLINSFRRLAQEIDDQFRKDNINWQVNELFSSYVEFNKMVDLEQRTIQRLVMSRADRDFFRKKIHGEHAEMSRESHRRIAEAYSKIDSSVAEKLQMAESADRRQEILLEILNVLSCDWTVLELITTSRENAYMLFQVLNDRGKGLTEGELLRAATLELLEQPPYEEKQKEVADIWDSMLSREPNAIERYLRWIYTSHNGQRPGNASLFDDFLRCFFPLYGKYQTDGAQLSVAESDSVVETVRNLQKEFGRLDQLSGGEWPYENDTQTRQWNKDRLGLLLNELEHDYCLPLLLSAINLTPAKFAEIVESVERFYFRYKLIVNAHTTRMATAYSESALAIRNGPGAYSPSELTRKLARLVGDHASSEKFRAGIRDLRYKPTGSNKVIRYLVMTLEYYIRWFEAGALGRPVCMNKEVVFDFANTSIEHIYPQRPREGCEDTELYEVVHHLGNLTFLGHDDNKLAGNEAFAEKRAVFDASSIRLNKLIALNQVWTKEKLVERAAYLAEVADKVFVP